MNWQRLDPVWLPPGTEVEPWKLKRFHSAGAFGVVFRAGWMSLLLSVYVLSSSCSQCGGTPSQPPSVPRESAEDGFADDRDNANRYPFTVIVDPKFAVAGKRNRACSGVLIAPSLVLTAGNCVCVRARPVPGREAGGRTLIDASTCEATASVITYTYEVLIPGAEVEGWSERYQGSIHPHPELEILLGPAAEVLSSKANLAVIHLDRPTKGNTPPVVLAREEVRRGELVSVVGFTYFEEINAIEGSRRFSLENVYAPVDEETGQAPFGRPSRYGDKHDTGGPCLRETSRGPELVGISHRGFGQVSMLTSVPAVQEWLTGELHRFNPEGTVP